VNRFDPADQVSFKQEHLREIEGLRNEKGIRLDVGVLFSGGTVARP
jgi:hypothetical protein